jgi:MoaA/NifB/PqqE/SkfB family radical SAM enzyme
VKPSSFIKFSAFGISSILLKRRKAIVGTIILTDKCNLSCKHCAVNNITSTMRSYKQAQEEIKTLHRMGVRILFFCGGETFLWRDGDKVLRDLVALAKSVGFLIVNAVTNGMFALDLPEADLILLSLDGGKERHNLIRGDTFDAIMGNIEEAPSRNICLYMAINQLNKGDVRAVAEIARNQKNVRAASFNFHTPYPGTESLSLTEREKLEICGEISELLKEGYPIFNLKSAFPYLARNKFKTPCHQCVVMEDGKIFECGRCVDIPGLCEKCGYFFAAEYSLLFGGNVPVIFDMLKTYLKYV